MNLYQMTEDYIKLLDMAEEGQIDPEVLADTLEGISGSIEDKAEGYAQVIKTVQVYIDGIKAEEKRLAGRRRAMENNVKSLKENLFISMKATGKEKFKTNLFSFGIQKNAPSLIVDDETLVGEEFINIVTSVDKAAIKRAIKEGAEVQGIHFEQSESLRIR